MDVLRQSSDQIRRAAALLAEITDETAPAPVVRYQGALPDAASGAPDPASAREATILQAQRSFAALKLSQRRDRQTAE